MGNNVIPLKHKKLYKDCNGEHIFYGDILKVTFAEEKPREKFAPKPPFAMLVPYKANKDLIYISGMDEFVEITEFQAEGDEEKGIISGVEIFANRLVYEANLKMFQKGGVNGK